MEVVGFNKAKQDSIADRNRLYDSETENMLLREQLLDASVEMDKAAEDLNVKLLIIGVDVWYCVCIYVYVTSIENKQLLHLYIYWQKHAKAE